MASASAQVDSNKCSYFHHLTSEQKCALGTLIASIVLLALSSFALAGIYSPASSFSSLGESFGEIGSYLLLATGLALAAVAVIACRRSKSSSPRSDNAESNKEPLLPVESDKELPSFTSADRSLSPVHKSSDVNASDVNASDVNESREDHAAILLAAESFPSGLPSDLMESLEKSAAKQKSKEKTVRVTSQPLSSHSSDFDAEVLSELEGAAARGDLERVTQLAAGEIRQDDRGFAVIKAAQKGHLNVMKVLLQKPIDTNELYEAINFTLMIAVEGDIHVYQDILVELTNHGEIPEEHLGEAVMLALQGVIAKPLDRAAYEVIINALAKNGTLSVADLQKATALVQKHGLDGILDGLKSTKT